MVDGSLIATSGLILSTCYLASEYHTSWVFDRPIHSAAVILFCAGLSVVQGVKWFPTDRPPSAADYYAIPLEERRHSITHSRSSSTDSEDSRGLRSPSHTRKLRISFFALICLLCTRATVLYYVLRDVQCAGSSYQALIPFALALFDYLQRRHYKTIPVHEGDESKNRYNVLFRSLQKSPYVFVVTTFLLGLSSMLHASAGAVPASTYICPLTQPPFTRVPLFQTAGFVLDVCIVLLISQLLDLAPSRRAGNKSIGWTCMLSAGILTAGGIITFIAMPEHRTWIRSVPLIFHISLVKFTVASSLMLVSAVRTVQYFGSMTTSFFVLFLYTYATSFASVWTNSHPFPPLSSVTLLFTMTVAFLSAIFYYLSRAASEHEIPLTMILNPKVVSWLRTTIAVMFLIWTVLWTQKHSQANFHPIDLLIMAASPEHDAYVQTASASKTLEEAANFYEMKYRRNPPPNFDAWYEYATNRSTLIMDDFDNIYYDLLPFWSLSPAELRSRTWEMISNPQNGIGGVKIRDGKAEVIDSTVPGTHRWMVDGILRMVEKFGHSIPDMDLAINLNDEARVAVPYEQLMPSRKIGLGSERPMKKDADPRFTANRADLWDAVPQDPISATRFHDESFEPSFYSYGSVRCPPSSPARNQRWWDKSSLCLSCVEPHSIGQFISNWTLSASPCHQPDIADMHGLYISPGTFRNTHELMPVFSQSKPFGFNDILYPSAWNYMDKVKYEPDGDFPDTPFLQKQNTLYWRGASTEGVTVGNGAWKGMARQRFVHLVNNVTAPQPLLLPYPVARSKKKLAYAYASPDELRNILTTDVGFVDQMIHCASRDCTAQAAEFGFAGRQEFQKHWSYAYLYDGDGTGFSGRFLPFLESRSLPFKSALFREWYEGRLTPWLHFVPLDLRLHGLWGTLAYFAGFEGKVAGRMVKWDRRSKEAEMIAERGREWAGKVLRKEDMEVYFFRVLLEWGRLTDDRRDVLGFTV